MGSQHLRPLLAFALVALVCGLVIVHAGRADGLGPLFEGPRASAAAAAPRSAPAARGARLHTGVGPARREVTRVPAPDAQAPATTPADPGHHRAKAAAPTAAASAAPSARHAATPSTTHHPRRTSAARVQRVSRTVRGRTRAVRPAAARKVRAVPLPAPVAAARPVLHGHPVREVVGGAEQLVHSRLGVSLTLSARP